MPRRRIGQETMFGASTKRSSLDEIAELVDWAPIERQLEVIHATPRGEASWPPLVMFRSMLLAVWHDLSDVMSWSAETQLRIAGMAGPTFAAMRLQAGKRPA
jgi:IS5 family transposase